MNDVKCETFDLPEHTKGQDPSHSSHREAYLDVEQYDGKLMKITWIQNEEKCDFGNYLLIFQIIWILISG